jgi:hypothetical protein
VPINGTAKPERAAALRIGPLFRPPLESNSTVTRRLVREALARAPRGEVRATATAVLEVLRARGFHLSGDQEARVRGTSDAKLLREWLRRAAIARSLAEVFQ